MAGERVRLTKEAAATIRAALKLFQETYSDGDVEQAQNDFPLEFDEVAPLDEAEIEELLLQLEE